MQAITSMMPQTNSVPLIVLGPIFPEVESYDVELKAAAEGYNEYQDHMAPMIALDAAAGIEAAARKFFLFVLGVSIITAPLIHYAMPKKMAWLRYVLLGIIGIVAAVAGYVWYVTYSNMTAISELADAAAANMAELEAVEDEAAARAEGELI